MGPRAVAMIARGIAEFDPDPRRGGDHPEFILRIHGHLAWKVFEKMPPNIHQPGLWAKEQLPELFRDMKHWRCGDGCPRATALPSEEVLKRWILERWGRHRNIRDRVAEVVAYHHRLSPATIKRRFAARFP